MLNIMIVKLRAANIADGNAGSRTRWPTLVARVQAGTVPSPIAREKIGLRYPSGMCMRGLLRTDA